MSTIIGRVTLRDPRDVGFVAKRSIDNAVGPTGDMQPGDVSRSTKGYRLRGMESGSSAQTTMDLWEREQARLGSVYVRSTAATAQIPEGWYELEDPEYVKPSGAPSQRPWSCTLWQSPLPFIVRQAEDDNVTGADTADLDCEEALKVVYTPTTSEVVVLQPRTASGAEKVNLPYGSWKAIARVYQATNNDAKFRWKTTDASGSTLVSGSQVAIGSADTWVDLDLGTIAVAKANDKANWYELTVQGIAGHLGDVWIDRIYLVPQ